MGYLRALLRHQIVSNALSLYGVQFANYLLPLVTIPYLTRVLGPSAWGLVAMTQAYGAYLSLPVDYGFNFSGSREVARLRDDKEKLSDIFAAVTGAKILLACSCVALSLGVYCRIGAFRTHPLLLWTGVFASLIPCFIPVWYFLGLERLKLVATLDVASRSIATVGIFLAVHSTGDAWRVFAVYAVGGSVAAAAGMALAYREVDLRVPSWAKIWRVLREGRSMFVSRTAIGSYSAGNAFILGLFAPPLFVGYYAGAEKMVRAALQLFQPPYMALFPRISNLVHEAPVKAFRLARISAVAFEGAGLLGGSVISVTAPWLVRIVLGNQFAPAVPILRIFTLLLPLIALGMVQGGLWMIPHGHDHAFEAITLGAGAVNLGLAFLLAPRYLSAGMAWAVVIAELFVAAVMFLYLNAKKRGFWGQPSDP